ncbi:MAG: TPM domain-containing protein [Kiritimatiellia bacterium]
MKGDAARWRTAERASYLLVVLAICVLLVPRAAVARSVPQLTGRIVDQAGLLGGDAARVETAIRGLEQATGGQMAILTVPTLGNDALEPFSMRVAEAWKIGAKGKDNGALLVIVNDSHDIRLEIGYGWEGTINDARAGDIIRGLKPFFRANRFGDGCIYAVGQVQGFVTGKPPVEMPVAPRTQRDGKLVVGGREINPNIIFFLFFVIIIIIRLCSRGRGSTYSSHGTNGWFGGGFSSGGGGGGFSGGGGSFGGGGASGRW